jgi:hypothetical protein
MTCRERCTVAALADAHGVINMPKAKKEGARITRNRGISFPVSCLSARSPRHDDLTSLVLMLLYQHSQSRRGQDEMRYTGFTPQ